MRLAGQYFQKILRRGLLSATVVLSCLQGEPTDASAQRTLSILSPLEFLDAGLVDAFQAREKVRVKVGFMSTLEDTNYQVRQSATVWDIVISDAAHLNELGRQGRLRSLRSRELGLENSEEVFVGTGLQNRKSKYFLPLLINPVGLSCKLRSGEGELRISSWEQLTQDLISQRVVGEVVLNLSLAVQALLADAMVSEAGGEGAQFRMQKIETRRHKGDPRVNWLESLHWKVRAPRADIITEMMRDEVSCFVGFLSQHHMLQSLLEADTNQENQESMRLVFTVPGEKTIGLVMGAALTEESARGALGLKFLTQLYLKRESLAQQSGLCWQIGADAPQRDCRFNLLSRLLRRIEIAEDAKQLLLSTFYKKNDLVP